jgi:HAE1 family hydrophobic/amphiphilic exporter-1
MIMIEFLFGKDMNVASQEVRDAISSVRSDLPTEMKEPIIQKFNNTDRPIVSIAISSSVLSPAELTRLADPGITRELRAITGVSDVQICGKVERELTVEVDPHASSVERQRRAGRAGTSGTEPCRAGGP